MVRTLLIFCLLFLSIAGHAQQTLIHCGKLIDVRKQRIMENMTIVVEGNTIVQIEKGYKLPREAGPTMIDLKDKVVMPGLMDMHVHLEQEMNRDKYIQKFTRNEADIAFESTRYAERTLMTGFTTVRDLGGTGVNTALRNAINKGQVLGPRVYSAGKALSITGGHADPTNGYKKSIMGDPGPAEGIVNGPTDARKAVRQRYKNGADVIKITATGGVLSLGKDGTGPHFSLEEMEAIVQAANDLGMKVAAHAHGDEGMYRAVQAGVASIEHGTLMTDRTMDLMIEKGTYLVPTITAGKAVEDSARIQGFFPAMVAIKALHVGPKIHDTFGRAYERGVKIAFGTDAGVFRHGSNPMEFKYMTEKGMPALEAIQCATLNAALLLGEEDKLGTIEAGKLADIVAVNEDPRNNINTMLDVVFVMKDGVVYKQP